MDTKSRTLPLAAVVGLAAGVLSFAALEAFTAQQTFTVQQVMSDPKVFYNREVAVEGIVGPVRAHTKTINFRTNERVNYLSFALYTPGDYKGRGKHYVSISLPAASFRYQPTEGQPMAVTGPLAPPLQVGSIEQ